MSDPDLPPARRAAWPRLRVRARRACRSVVETVSFLAAVAGAVARFVGGRWPEPLGTDYLAPRGGREPAPRRQDVIGAGRS